MVNGNFLYDEDAPKLKERLAFSFQLRQAMQAFAAVEPEKPCHDFGKALEDALRKDSI